MLEKQLHSVSMFSEVSTIDDFTGDVPADDLLPEVTGIDSLTTCSGRVTGSTLVMERSSSQ